MFMFNSDGFTKCSDYDCWFSFMTWWLDRRLRWWPLERESANMRRETCNVLTGTIRRMQTFTSFRISLIIFGQFTLHGCLFMFRKSNKLMFGTHSSFLQAFVSLTISNQISRPAISIIWEHQGILQEYMLTWFIYPKYNWKWQIVWPDINIANRCDHDTMTQFSQREWGSKVQHRDNLKQAYQHYVQSSCLMLLSLVLILVRPEPLTRASHAVTIKLQNRTPTLQSAQAHWQKLTIEISFCSTWQNTFKKEGEL